MTIILNTYLLYYMASFHLVCWLPKSVDNLIWLHCEFSALYDFITQWKSLPKAVRTKSTETTSYFSDMILLQVDESVHNSVDWPFLHKCSTEWHIRLTVSLYALNTAYIKCIKNFSYFGIQASFIYLPVLKIFQNAVVAFGYIVGDTHVWDTNNVQMTGGKCGRCPHWLLDVVNVIVTECWWPPILHIGQSRFIFISCFCF